MTGRQSGGGRRILVVEDDRSILMGLRMNLQAEGYEVVTAEDGATALELVREDFHLVILDLMLPRVNGFEILRRMRSEEIRTPVIVLSARTSEMDKVTGLDLGADDYMTKPFGLSELLARVRAALRRHQVEPAEAWRFGEIEVDPATREVRRGGELVLLTATEFDVLATLARANGRVLSRTQVYEAVWGADHYGTRRTVDNFIAQLRGKLEEDATAPRHLVTVRGVGYRLIE
jgi:DNA-binding response OmpR family regulator